MTKEVTTVSEEGYKSENQVRDFEVTIDATGEDAPDTLESLLAAYGSCYVPALRVGAEQRDVGDLGRIEIDVTGDLNDDDKLDAVQFTVKTETEMDDEQAGRVVERADQLCKVHDALKTDLEADVTVEGGAL
ncbi:OsmC family protein [Halorussus salinisoli]|uniref:OsmC family protein n=1 Tax=Halorussus salinisoli TaxID=2558242 RepID=UPI0010C1EDC3|nr:OsmC family protein [Halorussus salinisoli]